MLSLPAKRCSRSGLVDGVSRFRGTCLSRTIRPIVSSDNRTFASSTTCASADAPASIAAPEDLNKKVVSSVLACAGAALADPLISLIDTAYVGQLGVLPLAALGPNAALFNVVFFIGFSAIGVVATNQISAAHGAGDRAAAGRALITSVVSSILLGVAITVGLMFAPVQALQVFQTNAEMMPQAMGYCKIRCIGVVCALLMIVFQAAFRALEDMRTPFTIVMLVGAFNIIVDPLLMFGCGMGMAGAAWATILTQTAGAVCFASIISRRRHEFGLPQAWAEACERAAALMPWPAMALTAPGASSKAQSAVAAAALPATSSGYGAVTRPNGVSAFMAAVRSLYASLPWRDFLSTTFKLATRCCLILATWTMASGAATSLGTYTIAAYQIMQQVLQLQLSVCWAFLAVGQSLVAVAMARARASAGQRDGSQAVNASSSDAAEQSGCAKGQWTAAQEEGRLVGDRVIRLAMLVSCTMAVATFALRSIIPRLFTSSSAVLTLIDGAAAMMCVMLAISWNNAVEGVLMGAQDTQFVINIYPASVLGFAAALAGFGFLGWGLTGIWGALVTYYAGLVTLLSFRYWCDRFRVRI